MKVYALNNKWFDHKASAENMHTTLFLTILISSISKGRLVQPKCELCNLLLLNFLHHGLLFILYSCLFIYLSI